MSLHHVGVTVSDLFALELFYRKALGFRPGYRYTSLRTPGLRTVFLERDGFALELLCYEGRPVVRGDGHLALAAADVDAEYWRLRALGIQGMEPPRDTGDGMRELALRDPEGNLIEICARVRPPPRPEIRAAIFDLDGTLIDSEENYFQADRQVLAEHGVTLTREVKAEYVGRSNQEVLAAFRERFGLSDPVERLIARKNELYLELARRSTPVFPKMAELVRRLSGLGLPLAVATGTSPDVLEAILAQTGLAPFFKLSLSAEGGRSKPAPDIFLQTARRLGVEPQHAVVFEDSQYGVEAACRAGMACVAIPFQAPPPLPFAFQMADLLFERGMEQLDVEAVVAFVRERTPGEKQAAR